MSETYVTLEFTPNPNTLKYAVNRVIHGGGAASFRVPEEARERSPIAWELLSVAGVSAVMIGRDFVTVTKTENGDWDLVHREASRRIEAFARKGEPAVIGEVGARVPPSVDAAGDEKRIVEFLENEIRPAVAMDGGDIAFQKFEDGVVYVFLQGSCSGCPSSTATLKDGIEARLRELVPSVREVVAV